MKSVWEHATIGRACQLVNGGTPKTKVAEYWDGPHAWITPAEMGGRESPYLSDTRRTLSEDGLSKSSATLLPPYSIIMSSRAPIGHLVINEVPMATNQGCKGLVPGEGLHYKFLYYYLYSIVDLLNDLGTGATFKELSATKLKGVAISLPTLPEQKRIVAILDEAFAGIAAAVANTEKNLANARELFESHLNAVFTRKGDGWVEKTLGELCEKIDYGHTASAKETGDGPKFLRITDIQNGLVDWPNVPVCRCELNEQEKYRLQHGDIVFARTGATTGKSYLIKECPEGAVFASYLIRVRPNHSVLPTYLANFFLSLDYWNQIKQSSSGSAQPGVNATKLKNLSIPLPPLREQKQIVDELDTLRADTQRLESIYRQKLDSLAELKQSILQKAFSGELRANPDKALKEAAT